MKRIPDVLLHNRSTAESRIFDALADVDLGHGWTAFHSLNCSEHHYKQWSEIDFLLLGPHGVFVLEVKGGGIGVRDGIWTYTNRNGQAYEHYEGPFGQAKSARYALEKLLVERYDLRSNEIYPRFGFGVLFPDCPWDVSSPEMPREIVGDKHDTATPDRLRETLRRIINYWSAKNKQSAPLGDRQLSALRQKLRPNVDVYPPFSSQLGHIIRQIETLTNEQFVLLDALEANPRVVVSGGAGTGKTFLLLQSARREAARDRKVLVVTESEILAAHLRALEPNQCIQIGSRRYLQRARTELADVLFVDEGQDLLSYDVFIELGEHVRGGMENGRWRWFMDENHQSRLSGVFDQEALDYLSQGLGGAPPVRLSLTRNVRNSKAIVAAVEAWTGAPIGEARAEGFGAPPKRIACRDQQQLVEAVEARLDELAAFDVRPEDIGIVISERFKVRFLQALSKRWRRKCLSLDVTTVRANLAGKVLVGTPSEFKGLEKPVDIVVDLEPGESPRGLAAFYVATTRANYDLTVVDLAPA